jgi:hypothetical protein
MELELHTQLNVMATSTGEILLIELVDLHTQLNAMPHFYR